MNAVMTEHQPLGAAWATPVDTAMRSHDPITVSFFYDGGGAATPPTAAAVGTSAALSITTAASQTVSGNFVVTDAEIVMSPDDDHRYNVTFTPTGTITWDVAA